MKSRHTKKLTHRNPSTGRFVSHKSKVSTMENPKHRFHKRHAGKRRTHRNPWKADTHKIFSKGTMIDVAGVSTGVLSCFLLNHFAIATLSNTLSQSAKGTVTSMRGLVSLLAGVFLSAVGKGDFVDALGLGLAGAGVYDLVAVNALSSTGAPALAKERIIYRSIPVPAGSDGSALNGEVHNQPRRLQAEARNRSRVLAGGPSRVTIPGVLAI